MEINVSQLLKEPVGSIRYLKIEESLNSEFEQPFFHLTGTLTLIHIDKGILIKGPLTSIGTATCNRCMTPFEYSIIINFEEIFSPTIDINTGLPLYIKGDEFIINMNNTINLDEALYQSASLNMPMKLLCKDNCAGICLNCGQNLNNNTCKCEPDKQNNIWSKLTT